MGFTVPNPSGLTYPNQGQVDQRDFDILTASQAGFNVSSGCAVTASGSSLVLTVAAGAVRFGPSADVVVAGNTATVTTAHATLTRYDLVVVDNTGVASIIAGTAATAPEFPSFNPATQIVLAAVTVLPTVTTLATANLVDTRVIVAGMAGVEIDSSERTTTFDIQANGLTYTTVEGLDLIVAPQIRPYMISLSAVPFYVTAAAIATGTFQQVVIQMQEWYVTSGTAHYIVRGSIIDSHQAASLVTGNPIRNIIHNCYAEKRIEPHTDTKTYRVEAAQNFATPTNWTSTQILCGDGNGAVDSHGSVLGYQPALYKAVSL